MTAEKTRGATYICFSLVTTGSETELWTEWLGSDVKVADAEQRFQTTGRELVWLAHAQHTRIQDIEQRVFCVFFPDVITFICVLQPTKVNLLAMYGQHRCQCCLA